MEDEQNDELNHSEETSQSQEVEQTSNDISDDELEPKTPIQHALKFGGLLGMAGAIFTLLVYVIDAEFLVNMWMLLILLVFLGLVVYGGISYRNEIGGYIDFGPAYKHGFTVLVVMGAIGLVMNLLLYNVIDPGLAETLTDASMEQTRGIMESFGAPVDSIDEALEEARQDAEEGFTTMGLIKSYFYSIIFYAVISLITALIVRRREKFSDVM